MLDDLREFHSRVRALKSAVNKETGSRISKAGIRGETEELSTHWFSDLAPTLSQQTCFTAETLERYSAHFASLLKLSKPNNHKSRYLSELTGITKRFHDELVLPIQKQPKVQKEVSALVAMLSGLPDAGEDAYLKEAIACAATSLYRGAAVLGWCAAIDRIHRVIEKVGFNRFNTTSQQMTATQSGRFKRFKLTSRSGCITLCRLKHVYRGCTHSCARSTCVPRCSGGLGSNRPRPISNDWRTNESSRLGVQHVARTIRLLISLKLACSSMGSACSRRQAS